MPARRRNFNAHVKRLVAARGGWRCGACDAMLDATFECDHVVPLHRGGEDTVEALVALCCPCHRAKTQREEVERLAALRAAAEGSGRPPMCCTRCHRVVSPYFVHTCPPCGC